MGRQTLRGCRAGGAGQEVGFFWASRSGFDAHKAVQSVMSKTEARAPHLLIVEDDPDTAELIREALVDHFKVDHTTTVYRLKEALAQDISAFDLVLSDFNLPDGTALEGIDQLLKLRQDLPIVVVTSEGTLDIAIEAIRRGAYDYVVKTGDYLFTIPLIVEKNLEVWRTKHDNLRLHDELEQTLKELSIKNQQLEEAVSQLELLASTDALTGLANRRHVEQMLDRMFAEASRYGSDLACLMIDLDAFKELNDSLGHQMGDRVLQATGRVLAANCRRSDIAGRYGGDEFVLLLPHTSPEVAEQVARRIQHQFHTTVRSVAPGAGQCNMSIGLACMSLNRPASAEQLVTRADAALYKAKRDGKARIELAAQPGGANAVPIPARGNYS